MIVNRDKLYMAMTFNLKKALLQGHCTSLSHCTLWVSCESGRYRKYQYALKGF